LGMPRNLLVVFATLVLGDVVTVSSRSGPDALVGDEKTAEFRSANSHVVRKLLKVRLLLGQLALELEQLLLLALPDGVVLAGALAPLEGVAGDRAGMSAVAPVVAPLRRGIYALVARLGRGPGVAFGPAERGAAQGAGRCQPRRGAGELESRLAEHCRFVG